IVPKASATLDRYTSIGIHANHMDMTKFSSDDDPDYRNVRCELQRLIENISHQPKDIAFAGSSGTEGKFSFAPQDQGYSAGEQDQIIVPGEASSNQSTRSVNTFSGTFHAGKIIQGSSFDSKGGTMNF
ncbi:MAG: hypothetical protein Q9196_007371, partial [Gyalolechia fulgens]